MNTKFYVEMFLDKILDEFDGQGRRSGSGPGHQVKKTRFSKFQMGWPVQIHFVICHMTSCDGIVWRHGVTWRHGMMSLDVSWQDSLSLHMMSCCPHYIWSHAVTSYDVTWCPIMTSWCVWRSFRREYRQRGHDTGGASTLRHFHVYM